MSLKLAQDVWYELWEEVGSRGWTPGTSPGKTVPGGTLTALAGRR